MAVVNVRSPRLRRAARIGAGAAVVIVIVIVVGTGPFFRGIAAVSPGAILAALLFTAVGTSAAAWRWRTIARGLGLRLSWGAAIVAYYRSQFLNAVLPGGVVGDVHRAFRDGRRSGEPVLAARAVVTDRVAGQLVQLVLVVWVLGFLGLTTSLSGLAWILGALAVLLALAVAILASTVRGRRAIRRELATARRIFARPRTSLAVVASSTLLLASLASTFVVACLAVGVHTSLRDLTALAVIALAAGSLPINVGGWGPREAAAASAFAVVGLGGDVGVAASTAFGVLSLISVSPGVLVLVVDRIAAARSRRAPADLAPADPLGVEPQLDAICSNPIREETIA